jgi:hypothetical protein
MTAPLSDLPENGMESRAWPNPTQLLLLRACLESGAEARDAWKKWSSVVDLDHLDYQSSYLLPMLDHNLRLIGITGHPWLGRIKGYRRYVWAKNRRLLTQGSQLIEGLRSVIGDELLVIKGAALAWGYYPDSGLRQMEDFDFMIKPASALPVFDYLKGAGWQIPQWFHRRRRANKIPASLFFSTYSHNMRRGDGLEIDLHWNLMNDLCGTDASEIFWDAAVSMQLPDGSEVRTLAPGDLLFHCCLHGLLWSPVPPTRWILDAVTLLRNGKRIQWQRLIDVSERFCYTLRLGTALKYLAYTFPRQAIIPEEVIHCLLDRRHSTEELGEYRMRLFPGCEKYRPNVVTYYRQFRAHSTLHPRSRVQEIRLFAFFLMKCWNVHNLWLVFILAPFFAARRIYRRYAHTRLPASARSASVDKPEAELSSALLD